MLADELFDWLTELPFWQRDLARRLSVQIDLDDDEYANAMAMVRGAFGLPTEADAPAPRPIQREDMTLGTQGVDMRLLGLGSLQGVGLVGNGEALSFGEAGLTIVYGQNAAGKSTYVRVLKKLCRTVDRDCRILGNIYDATAPAPSARISLKQDGQVIERRTELDVGAGVRIAGMSVFDSACAELYVDAQNAVQYIPTELRLLARLANLQDRMRHDIAIERDALQREQSPLDAYPAITSVGRAVRTLTGRPNDPDLAALSSLDEAEVGRLAELRAVVAAAQTSTLRADAAAAKRDAEEAGALSAAIDDLTSRTNAEAASNLRTVAANAREAQAAVALAAEQLQGPLPGVGGGPWQVLWNAARSFIESEGAGVFPPDAGQPCPFCLQTISSETAERLAHFQEHVTGVVQATADERVDALRDQLEATSPEHATRVATMPLLVALSEREPDLAASVNDIVEDSRRHLSSMTSTPELAIGCTVDTTPAKADLRKWQDEREAHARTLNDADDTDKLPQLKAELAELEARELLAQELSAFLQWQQTLRVIQMLDAAHSSLATNKITTAQRTMIEDGLGKELDAALGVELRNLACDLPVQMSTHIARAETSVGLRLLASDPPRVSEIASDGERRALALCFFLAELEVAHDLGGIVLDDPVSSLDDERRTYIAQRLIREATQRQVIVFTHDLPFVFELRSGAKSAGIEVHIQNVWRQGEDVGRVDQHPPFKTLDLRGRVAKLADEVQAMRKEPAANNDEAWRRVDGFYKRVRTSWERAVEERLFGGVVERFERDVKTLQFRYIKVTPERIQVVETGMKRASRFVHEDAYGAQVPLPSINDMADDVEALRAFERDTRPDN